MAIELKHATVATVIPSGEHEIDTPQWNENHMLTLTSARLVGRTTAGAGAAEEISVGTGLSLSGLSLTFNTTWGDARYALAGHNHSGVYLESETDPVFSASAAAGIAVGDISAWNTAFGWGNHASVGYLTTVSWGDVTGKPSTFPPSAHGHSADEITTGTLALARGGTGRTDGYSPRWITARTFTIGASGKSVTGAANVSWTLAEIGAQDAATAIKSSTGGTVTISSLDPSGGVNGDIWFKV